ncbi:MAG: glycosyltransferase family 4 protein [Nitrososphaera sp.]|uniref:glycosyltransferase family 4 protein n=1 Tax=Nitrososphaera sp. TaxID=1971748 RepID=UPI003D6FF20F
MLEKLAGSVLPPLRTGARANVVHTDLDPCGGAEQLAVATLQALVEMGIQVDLTVAKAPDLKRLENAFGKRVGRIFDRIREIKPLGRIFEADPGDYDLTINTHGDILPYFTESFSRRNAVTYCHYPVAADYVRDRDQAYLQSFAAMGLIDRADDATWGQIAEHYRLMLQNSLVVTNSHFSSRAIALYTAHEPAIITPPVNVEEFRAILSTAPRGDSVLVVSRIHPSKKLENAIALAGLLKERGVGKEFVIAGNLSGSDQCGQQYHARLLDMAKACGVSDYVKIKANVKLDRLYSLMKKSKVYFHPLPGEPFGISVVEAMSAGLVPVVPDTGGLTEFVPRGYQFHSLRQAADIVASSMDATAAEREALSDSVRGFSLPEYVSAFQKLTGKMLDISASPAITA